MSRSCVLTNHSLRQVEFAVRSDRNHTKQHSYGMQYQRRPLSLPSPRLVQRDNVLPRLILTFTNDAGAPRTPLPSLLVGEVRPSSLLPVVGSPRECLLALEAGGRRARPHAIFYSSAESLLICNLQQSRVVSRTAVPYVAC